MSKKKNEPEKTETASEGKKIEIQIKQAEPAKAAEPAKPSGDFMTVERAGKAVNANRVRASKTHPSAGSAPDFAAVIRGEVAGGEAGSHRGCAPVGSGTGPAIQALLRTVCNNLDWSGPDGRPTT